jgi:O-antigen/teichoic acid export membrane protein
VKQIVKNSFWLGASDVVVKVIVFFFILLLARKLGVHAFGQYSFAVSLVLLFSQFTNLGLPIFLTREIARDKESTSRYIGGAMLFAFPVAIILPFVMFIIAKVMGYLFQTQTLVLLLGVWIAIDGLIFILKSSFYAHEKMQYISLLNLNFQILRFSLVYLIFLLGWGVLWIGGATLVASLCIFVLAMFVFFQNFGKPNFKIDLRFWLHSLRQTLPLALLATLLGLFGKVDIIMISLMTGDGAAGIYSAAFKLTATFIFVPAIIVQAAFPRLSQHAFMDEHRFSYLITSLLKIIVVCVVPVALTFIFLAQPIIQLIYGTSYGASSPVLRVLAWTTLINGVCYLLIYAMNAKNRQAITAICASGALLVNIGLNAAIIPRFGPTGAACSSLISEIIFLLSLIAVVLKNRWLNHLMLIPSIRDAQVIYRTILERGVQ